MQYVPRRTERMTVILMRLTLYWNAVPMFLGNEWLLSFLKYCVGVFSFNSSSNFWGDLKKKSWLWGSVKGSNSEFRKQAVSLETKMVKSMADSFGL